MVESGVLTGDIEKALARRDSKALEMAAHALKGTGWSSLCASQTLAGALKLERLARSGEIDAASVAFRELEADIERAKSALAALAEPVAP
jgi:hypothetical protein